MEIKELKVADLSQPERMAAYQKGLKEKFVQRLVDNWNDQLADVPLVSIRDGAMFVVDGQHRITAASRIGIESIPCRIVRNLTYEQEASLFIKANTEKKKVAGAELTFAMIESGNAQALAFKKLYETSGYRLSRTKRAKGVGGKIAIQPHGTLFSEFAQLPVESREALSILAEALPGVAGVLDEQSRLARTSVRLIGGLTEGLQIWMSDSNWTSGIRSDLVSVLSDPRKALLIANVEPSQAFSKFSNNKRPVYGVAHYLGEILGKKRRSCRITPLSFAGKTRIDAQRLVAAFA